MKNYGNSKLKWVGLNFGLLGVGYLLTLYNLRLYAVAMLIGIVVGTLNAFLIFSTNVLSKRFFKKTPRLHDAILLNALTFICWIIILFLAYSFVNVLGIFPYVESPNLVGIILTVFIICLPSYLGQVVGFIALWRQS